MPRSLSTAARLVALAAVLAGATGCSPTRLVEERIAEALPRYVGPADGYTVAVEGLSLRGAAARRVTAVGTRVRPAGAPEIARLDLVLDSVAADVATSRLTRVARARATATITAAALAARVAADSVLHAPVLTLAAPDELTLRGRPALSGISFPGADVEITGRLTAAADGTIHLDVTAVRALGVRLPSALARELTERLNPVADLRRTRARLRVTAVRVEAGHLVVEADADPAALVRPAAR